MVIGIAWIALGARWPIGAALGEGVGIRRDMENFQVVMVMALGRLGSIMGLAEDVFVDVVEAMGVILEWAMALGGEDLEETISEEAVAKVI